MASFRLAHLSDLHLGPLPSVRPLQLLNKRVIGYVNWRRGRKHKHRTDVVEALIIDLKEQAPEHIVVSGDLVNISLPAEFVAAGAWLRALGTPEHVTVVPGNHDAYVPLAWHEAWMHWSEYMSGDNTPAPPDPRAAFPFLRRRGAVTLVGLSSAVASPPTFATGRLGRRQLGRLDSLLGRLDGEQCRIVILHHPPVRALTGYRRRLVDEQALAQVLVKHGAELVLCGHEHEMKLGSLPGPDERIPVVVAPSASHGGPARQGGYLIYALEQCADGCQISFELRTFNSARGTFSTISKGWLSGPAAPPAMTSQAASNA